MSSIDVIVPCYRYGHYLRQCVESVLAQTMLNVRVLILDDASPDNTEEIGTELEREDSRVTFLRHLTNKGHIATYNEGIEWVSADYLLLLSADDYLLPGALSQSTEFMDLHPEVGFTFGRIFELHDSGLTKQETRVNKVSHEYDQCILSGHRFIELSGARNIVPTPTAVIRTELQKRVGGYKPQLPHSGDLEMWLRLATHASVGVFGAFQAVYRCHADNMSKDYMNMLNKTWLPDLQQRKAAFDCFIEDSENILPGAQALYQRMLWLLGCDAISFASGVYNDADIELSDQLCEFAFSVCPEVRRSWPSVKLACKRHIGLKRWLALQAVFAGLPKLG
jgi:glycosyltransferase involved in cell wall biosynthesis